MPTVAGHISDDTREELADYAEAVGAESESAAVRSAIERGLEDWRESHLRSKSTGYSDPEAESRPWGFVMATLVVLGLLALVGWGLVYVVQNAHIAVS